MHLVVQGFLQESLHHTICLSALRLRVRAVPLLEDISPLALFGVGTKETENSYQHAWYTTIATLNLEDRISVFFMTFSQVPNPLTQIIYART